jgi:WD40 repeat protein
MLTSVKVHGGKAATTVAWCGSQSVIATGGLDASINFYQVDTAKEAQHVEYKKKLADTKEGADAPEAPPAMVTKLHTISGAHALGVISVGCSSDGAGKCSLLLLITCYAGIGLNVIGVYEILSTGIMIAVLASTGTNGDIAIWSTTTYEKIGSISTGPSEAWKLAFAPNGPHFTTGGFGGKVNIFSTESAALVSSVATTLDFVNNVAYSPDGERIAAVGVNGQANIIDVASGTVLAVLDAHYLPVRAVAFSHDGRMLYTGSDDRRVNVFDVSGKSSGTGNLVSSLHDHLHWVTGVAAPPDNYTLASCSADKSVRIWDVRKRGAIHIFEGYTDKLWDVSWNHEGLRLAAVSDGGVFGLHSIAAVI